MQARISANTVRGLQPRQVPYEVVDTDLKGFLARVQPSGVIAYYFSYRNTDGIRKRFSIGKHGTLTPTQARDAAERAAGRVALGDDPATDKKAARAEHQRVLLQSSQQRTLGEFLNAEYTGWCSTHKKRGLQDVKRLRAAFSEFMDLRLDDLTAWQLQNWRADRTNAGAAVATVNRDLSEIRALLNRAVEWGFLVESPARQIKMLKTDNSRVRYLTKPEETRLRVALDARDELLKEERERGNAWRKERGYDLMSDLKAGRYGDHITPMVLLALNTGMRRGEIFGLIWGHVNPELRQLTVTAATAKSRKQRHIPLNVEAFAALESWRTQNGGPTAGLVFSNMRGDRFDNVNKAWRGVLVRAKLSNFHFHDLRHSFASKLVMRGVDLNTVRELLGHEDIKMTLRYAHLAPEHKAAAVAALLG